MENRVVVYPPDEREWRRVRYDGEILALRNASGARL